MQLLTQKQCEFLDFLGCDNRLCQGETARQTDDPIRKFIAPEPEVNQPLAYRGVVGVDQALLDQLQKPSDTSLGFLVILPHLTQAIPVSILALDRCAQIFIEQSDEMITPRGIRRKSRCRT